MRLVLQRVASASVTVAGEPIAAIGRGLVVLCGVEKGDGPSAVEAAARKLAGLRVFDDADGRMNLDTATARGSFLLISQFTLAGSLDRGRRPSFDGAAPGGEAEPLIEALAERLRRAGQEVATGRFGAPMQVTLVNDGPVTFVLDL